MSRGLTRGFGPTTRSEIENYRGFVFNTGKMVPLGQTGEPTVDRALEQLSDDVERYVSLLVRYLDDDGRLSRIEGIISALRTGLDTKIVTGTAGSSGQSAVWNGDGDIVGQAVVVAESHTIASGAITLTASPTGPVTWILTVDGEGAAADDLDTINGTRQNDRIIIQCANAARDITLTASGNMNIGGFNRFTLRELQDKAELIDRDGGSNLDALSLRNN